MSRHHKINFTVAYTLILALIISVVTLYSWVLDKKYPVEVVTAEVIEDPLMRGDALHVHWRLIKKRSCVGKFVRHVIDSENVVWDLYSDNENTYLQVDNNPVDITRAYVLPAGVAIGPARFRSIVNWQCNPLKMIRQEVADIPFIISEP